jgi:hypothetical protein
LPKNYLIPVNYIGSIRPGAWVSTTKLRFRLMALFAAPEMAAAKNRKIAAQYSFAPPAPSEREFTAKSPRNEREKPG